MRPVLRRGFAGLRLIGGIMHSIATATARRRPRRLSVPRINQDELVQVAIGARIADSDFRTTMDPLVFQAETRAIGASSEAWIAAYRMTPEGRQFPGVTRSLRWALGAPDTRQTQRVAAMG